MGSSNKDVNVDETVVSSSSSFSRAIAKGEEESLLSSLLLRKNLLIKYIRFLDLGQKPSPAVAGRR